MINNNQPNLTEIYKSLPGDVVAKLKLAQETAKAAIDQQAVEAARIAQRNLEGMKQIAALGQPGHSREEAEAIVQAAEDAELIAGLAKYRPEILESAAEIANAPPGPIATGEPAKYKRAQVVTVPYTKEDIVDSIPLGQIEIYRGLPIPAGWQICDGTSGTPNLTEEPFPPDFAYLPGDPKDYSYIMKVKGDNADVPTDPTRAEVKEAIDDFLQNEVVAKGYIKGSYDTPIDAPSWNAPYVKHFEKMRDTYQLESDVHLEEATTKQLTVPIDRRKALFERHMNAMVLVDAFEYVLSVLKGETKI
jgi:hypothetical protein